MANGTRHSGFMAMKMQKMIANDHEVKFTGDHIECDTYLLIRLYIMLSWLWTH